MKKIFTIVLFILALNANAQVKVGDNPAAINASAMLEAESTTKGLLPPRMTMTQMNAIASPAQGLVVYCTTCTPQGLYENDGTPAAAVWNAVGASSSVNVNCTLNGFAGTYASYTALDAANTFSVTVVNNSFSAATINFSNSDVVLGGVSGVSVASASPVSATINPGASQQVAYTLSGTPATAGTLTATFTKQSLSCTKMQTVLQGDAIRNAVAAAGCTYCTDYDAAATDSWIAVDAATYNKVLLVNGAAQYGFTQAEVAAGASGSSSVNGNYSNSDGSQQSKVPAGTYPFACQLQLTASSTNTPETGVTLKLGTSAAAMYDFPASQTLPATAPLAGNFSGSKVMYYVLKQPATAVASAMLIGAYQLAGKRISYFYPATGALGVSTFYRGSGNTSNLTSTFMNGANIIFGVQVVAVAAKMWP